MMIDLELFQKIKTLKQAQIDWLRSKGVPIMALACDPGFIGHVIGTAEIIFDGAVFDFADEAEGIAETAIIIIARDELGEPVDLVAWNPRSGRSGAYWQAVSILGAQSVCWPSLAGVTRVHPGILEWLQAGRDGCVIINRGRAGITLRDMEPLAVSSARHRQELQKLLAETLPRIVLARQRATA